MLEFEIAREPLRLVRRLDAVFCRLLAQSNLAIPLTKPQDVALLHRTIRAIRGLPTAILSDDLAVVIYTDRDPRRPYYRLQFGPKVINLASVQVVTDPNEHDEWVSIQAFDAIMGLSSGSDEPRLVAEFATWIDELEDECRRSSMVWQIEEGLGHVGYMAYPSWFFETDD